MTSSVSDITTMDSLLEDDLHYVTVSTTGTLTSVQVAIARASKMVGVEPARTAASFGVPLSAVLEATAFTSVWPDDAPEYD